MNKKRRLSRTIAAVLLCGSAMAAVAGCSFIEQQIGDAWAVTYEVSVDQPIGADLADIRIEGAENRGDTPSVHDVSDQQTTEENQGGSVWTHDLIVLAEQQASVRVIPPENATATCRILVGGDREIAKATSATPGAEVVCSADTPAFG